MAATDRKTITDINQFEMPGTVPNARGFNAIQFINKGTVIAKIAMFPLEPGESIGWSLNANELDTAQYNIDFPRGNEGASVWVISISYKD